MVHSKHSYTQLIRRYYAIPAMAMVLVLLFSFVSYRHIARFEQYIVNNEATPTTIRYAVVLGGGVNEGKPLPLLKDRLDKAKELLDEGRVDGLLLSGDNRTPEYDEPSVMYDYLISSGVGSQFLVRDFAGRSTYETCERAIKIFGLDEAIFISESTHLPRVLYLCRHFGIKAYGVASDGEASSGLKVGQRWREVLARNKAILNVYIKGEETVLGEPIPL